MDMDKGIIFASIAMLVIIILVITIPTIFIARCAIREAQEINETIKEKGIKNIVEDYWEGEENEDTNEEQRE